MMRQKEEGVILMSNWTLKEKSVGDLEVVVDGDVWASAQQKAFNKLAKNVTVPGFRKGSAPKALVEKYVSQGQVLYTAVDDHANEWMVAALKEQDLSPITQPQLDVKAIDTNSVTLVYTFTVKPEVTVKDYKNLNYAVEEVSVSQEDIDAELTRMQESYANLEVKEGEAANGDTVNIDYVGEKDGVAFEGGSDKGHNLVLGSGSFIPGFEDQLIGTKAGDQKDVEVTFPEDYHAKDLAGQAVVFHVTVNEVKVKVLPELNDEFAKDTNTKDVETLDQLKESIKARLTSSKQAQAEEKADNALSDQLLEQIEVELPEVMIEEEVQGQINQLASQIQQYGMSITNYLQMIGKTVDDLKKDYRDNAVKSLTLRLGLEKIAKLENLEASQEELDKQVNDIATMYGMEVDQVKKLIDVNLLKNDVLTSKAFELLKNKK